MRTNSIPPTNRRFLPWRSIGALAATVAVATISPGCSKGSADPAVIAKNPNQAASQLEQAFSSADSAAKQAANAAAEALRKGELEKAIVSLEVARSAPAVTIDQGLAIHSTSVMLESQLINAIQAGDKNAQRTYQMLKAMKAK